MTHATAIRDGFEVPLIGIPANATLEMCDLCREWTPVRKIELLADGRWCCPKCKKERFE